MRKEGIWPTFVKVHSVRSLTESRRAASRGLTRNGSGCGGGVKNFVFIAHCLSMWTTPLSIQPKANKKFCYPNFVTLIRPACSADVRVIQTNGHGPHPFTDSDFPLDSSIRKSEENRPTKWTASCRRSDAFSLGGTAR
jgi:hypothetical protein